MRVSSGSYSNPLTQLPLILKFANPDPMPEYGENHIQNSAKDQGIISRIFPYFSGNDIKGRGGREGGENLRDSKRS